jgi:hypothetical protein
MNKPKKSIVAKPIDLSESADGGFVIVKTGSTVVKIVETVDTKESDDGSYI